MRGSKAKRLRKAVGFHPNAPREYDKPLTPKLFHAHVTVKCGGQRGAYQKVKRTRVLTEAVLRAAVLEAA